jgi:transcription antitermination factor NusG
VVTGAQSPALGPVRSHTRLRRRAGRITPAEARKLDEFLRRAQAGILTKISMALDLQAGLDAIMAGPAAGQPVVITDGAFADLPATISQVDYGTRTLSVLLSVFGRQARVEVRFDQVARSEEVGGQA